MNTREAIARAIMVLEYAYENDPGRSAEAKTANKDAAEKLREVMLLNAPGYVRAKEEHDRVVHLCDDWIERGLVLDGPEPRGGG